MTVQSYALILVSWDSLVTLLQYSSQDATMLQIVLSIMFLLYYYYCKFLQNDPFCGYEILYYMGSHS